MAFLDTNDWLTLVLMGVMVAGIWCLMHWNELEGGVLCPKQ